MTKAPHWAAAYIGQPYIPGENDCWAFCRRLWAERFGIEVPVVDVDPADQRAVLRAFHSHPERVLWHEVAYPREGDAVLMAHSRFPAHVGLWIDADGGGVLHSERPLGVMFSTPQALARAGWARLRYYRKDAACAPS